MKPPTMDEHIEEKLGRQVIRLNLVARYRDVIGLGLLCTGLVTYPGRDDQYLRDDEEGG